MNETVGIDKALGQASDEDLLHELQKRVEERIAELPDREYGRLTDRMVEAVGQDGYDPEVGAMVCIRIALGKEPQP